MPSEPSSFRRVSSTSSRLIESYCDNCGLFVAGSPAEKILEIMERLHQCAPQVEALSREHVDRLLRELSSKEHLLIEWITSSERNSSWFAADPVSAIRAANLGIDDQVLLQLEMITVSIAKKLRSAS